MHLEFEDGKRFELDEEKPRTTIGRDPSNDIVLDTPEVSGFHACLLLDDGRLYLVDLGSRNGSYLNGKPVQHRAPVNPFDKLRFGEIEIELVDGARRRPTVVRPAVNATQRNTRVPAGGGDQPAAHIAAVLHLVTTGAGPARVAIRGNTRIGRDPANQLVLPRDTVSGRHAEIRLEGQVPVVQDLGATNGTYINDIRVDRQILRNGDRLRFDEIEYRVEIPSAGNGRTRVNPAIGSDAEGNHRPEAAATRISPAVAAAPVTAKPTVATAAVPQPPPPMEPPIAQPFSHPDSMARTHRAPSAGQPTRQGDAPPMGDSRWPAAPEAVPSTGNGFKWLIFSLDGRIGRMTYFLAVMAGMAISFLIFCIIQLIFYGTIILAPQGPRYYVSAVPNWILFFWPMLALAVKRFHDQNRTGHWAWLLPIPLISLVPAILLFFVPGTRGPNRFGPPPAK